MMRLRQAWTRFEQTLSKASVMRPPQTEQRWWARWIRAGRDADDQIKVCQKTVKTQRSNGAVTLLFFRFRR